MWKRKEPSRVRDQVLLTIALAVVLVLLGIVLFRWVQIRESSEQPGKTESTTQTEPTQEPSDESVATPQFDNQKLQAVLNGWQTTHAGTASVAVMNPQGEVLAEVGDINRVYFAASLYKLYVAYAGYQQLDNGEVDPDEIYVGDRTRAECLDAMIRSSDSPCAEALWNELGKENLTQALKKLGIQNTNMTSISTTARDAALILAYIARGEGLSSQSQQNYLSSMKEQDVLYRRGFPSGFSENVAVHNKVGWNEQVEWHDASIVVYPDGRQLIVSVLTESVGTKKIAQLATALEQATTEAQ